MGKGDKKSKKGKLSMGSYGVTRPHKVKATVAPKKAAAKKEPATKKEPTAKKKAATKE